MELMNFHSRSVQILLVLTVVVAFFSYPYPPSHLHTNVIIVIPSARENFELRQAVRKTWAKNIFQRRDLLLKFVVGEQACLVPPLYRENYACETNFPLDQHNSLAKLFTNEQTNAFSCKFDQCKPASVLGLRIKHSVILDVITLPCSFKLPASVSFVDPVSGKVYEFAQFEHSDHLICQNGSYHKALTDPLVLPKDLEIQLHFSYNEFNPSFACCYNESSFLVDITYVYENWSQKFVTNFTGYCGPSFLFTVQDTGALEELFSHSEAAHVEWLKKVTQQDASLRKEAAKYEDLLLAPVVDTYRNVSSKLTWFYSWAITHQSFAFLLKIDDDTLIDLDGMLNELSSNAKINSWSWWGHFRWNWPVLRAGKWAERVYAATVYPPFACGSAYLLGHDLVHFLGQNLDSLKHYQGEDVSLGIWLSAVKTVYEHDENWCCTASCSPSWIQGELGAEEMLKKWSQ